MKKISQIVVLLFISNVINAQSPWTRDSGKGYLQLGLSSVSFNQATNKNGEVESLGADFSDVTLQAYSEFGITNNLEAQLILPYKILSATNSAGTNSFSGLGNISVGLKYKFLSASWNVSGGLLVTPRTGKYSDATGLSTGFNANTFLPYISAGQSAGKWYYFGKIGYGYMDNKYSDFLNLTAEVGYNIIKNGHVMLVVDTKNIISEEDAFLFDAKQTISYPDRQNFNAIGVKTNYEFTKDKFGANLSVFGAFGAKNTPYAPSINLGVYSKF